MSGTSVPLAGDFGDYRIDARIGRGGMGVVYRAWQRKLNRPVALKVLPAELAEDPLYRSRFGREAAALARLDSPHVIQIYDHGEHDGNLFLAMQLIQGPDLGALLADGPLPPRRALRITAQVAAALADAHSIGVVHRDVKPSNVLIRPAATAADEDFVYLADFGIARNAADVAGGTGETAGVVGTLAYLAPERLDGEPAVPASDVYSLGCMLWALLTGAPPYEGSQPQVIMGHVRGPLPRLQAPDRRTRMLNALLAGMLAKAPAERPSPGAVRQQIRDILDTPGEDRSPTRRPAPTLPDGGRVRGPWRSRRVLIGAVVLAVVVTAALVAPGLWRAGPDERLDASTPVGATCRPTTPSAAAASAGVQAQRVCETPEEVGELRLFALPGGGAVETYLRTGAGQEPTALLEGSCPQDLPARQAWSRDGRGGTLLCYVLGDNTRYAWTVDDQDVVAVLDGRPQVPFPRDLDPVAEFFAELRYPT
ncbi:serine/threonine-protein kinase [Pseudonocardia lacus]|uniref:serine/threonine-protein kinase n=1 Tax=Pseudonocardia lacus TaxID=2835865 RepID=UPI001BDCAC2C|nr:serine/threonine-protein kinase [Pseudonocardia lacus]